MDDRKRIGEILIDAHVIDEAQLKEALAAQRGTGKRLGEVLVEMGLATESEVARGLSAQLNIPFISLAQTIVDEEAIDLVPRDLAAEHSCVPVKMSKRFLVLAMEDPLNLMAMEEVAFRSNRKVKQVTATRSEIKAAIQTHYDAKEVRDQVVKELRETVKAQAERLETSDFKSRLFAILSNKPGVGNTHTAMNLAYCLSQRSRRVLLIDADFGHAGVSKKLGISSRRTFLDLLTKDRFVEDAVTATPYGFRLVVGETGRLRLANVTHQQRLRFVRNFNTLAAGYDVVLMDLGAGADLQTLDFALAADAAIVVTTSRDVVSGYACAKLAFLRSIVLEARLAECIGGYEVQSVFRPCFVVDQVNSPDEGRQVFEKIQATAEANLGKTAEGLQMQCVDLGSLPYSRKNHARAEELEAPYAAAFPEDPVTECYRHLTSSLLREVGRPQAASRQENRFRRFAEIVGQKPEREDDED